MRQTPRLHSHILSKSLGSQPQSHLPPRGMTGMAAHVAAETRGGNIPLPVQRFRAEGVEGTVAQQHIYQSEKWLELRRDSDPLQTSSCILIHPQSTHASTRILLPTPPSRPTPPCLTADRQGGCVWRCGGVTTSPQCSDYFRTQRDSCNE